MNAYDIQQILIGNLNALSRLPITSPTVYRLKTNLLNSVKDLAESGAPIRIEPITEIQSMQLYGSGLVLLHIFYAMCLHWVPKITIIYYETVTQITKRDLINNKGYSLKLGQLIFYIKDGTLEIDSEC